MSKFVKLEYSGIIADNTLHLLSHRLLAVLDVLFEPISCGFSAAVAFHADLTLSLMKWQNYGNTFHRPLSTLTLASLF